MPKGKGAKPTREYPRFSLVLVRDRSPWWPALIWDRSLKSAPEKGPKGRILARYLNYNGQFGFFKPDQVKPFEDTQTHPKNVEGAFENARVYLQGNRPSEKGEDWPEKIVLLQNDNSPLSHKRKRRIIRPPREVGMQEEYLRTRMPRQCHKMLNLQTKQKKTKSARGGGRPSARGGGRPRRSRWVRAGPDEVPADFCCPISMQLMENPTINEAGQTYDCGSITAWYARGGRTDPLTRKPIQNFQLLIPNHHLKAQIENWKQQAPAAKRKKMEPADFKLACEIFAKEYHRQSLLEKSEGQEGGDEKEGEAEEMETALGPVPLLPMDVELMEKFESRLELIRHCETRAEEALRSLDNREATVRAEILQEFEQMLADLERQREHVEAERSQNLSSLANRASEMKQSISTQLETLRSHHAEHKATGSRLQRVIRSPATKWSGRGKRTEEIRRLTSVVLERAEPFLKKDGEPELSVKMLPARQQLKLRGALVRLSCTPPSFENRPRLDSNDTITISVKTQDNNLTFLTLKKETRFERVFQVFHKKHGMHFRFIFNGALLKPNKTPQDIQMEDGDTIHALMQQTGDIGVFGIHEFTPGRDLLCGQPCKSRLEPTVGVPMDSPALLIRKIGGTPASRFFASERGARLLDANQCKILRDHLDKCHAENPIGSSSPPQGAASTNREDLKIACSKRELEALIGKDCVTRCIRSFFPGRVDRIMLRRCAAVGKHINFHTDVAIRTMQVSLWDEKHYAGGRLMFVNGGGIQAPSRPEGSFTIHDNRIVHGVTELRAGIRYGLFFLECDPNDPHKR